MINDHDRIIELRDRCLKRKDLVWRQQCIDRARALKASEEVESWQVRQGLCVREILSNVRFELDDLELLVGRLAPRPKSLTDEEVAQAEEYLKNYVGPWGQTGHCELDLGPLFELGIDGLKEMLESKAEGSEGAKADTYRSFVLALEGLSRMIENAGRIAESAMAKSSEERRKELKAVSESCSRIAHKAPRSFRDGIQMLWLTTFAVQHGDMVWLIGPGHIDRTLRRLYEEDRKRNILSKDEALVLIESLYLLLNEYILDGLAIPVMVGGRDAEGREITNDLSYLCLEALRRTRLVYPTVGVCWHEDTPADLVDLAIELISQGYSTPAFFGDETIQKGMKALGVSQEQACNYINSTCVEITPVGSSNVWVASPYFNTCGLLLEEIAEQAKSPAESFGEFFERYKKRLASEIEQAAKNENASRKHRKQYGRKPLQSVFTRDCIERGLDIDNGGAIYNWVECSFVGLANLADSLYVIDREIFDKKRLIWPEMKELLDADFEGHEPTRLRFLNGYPKYGQGVQEVDGLVGQMVEFVQSECTRHKMLPDDSPFVPGSFVWIMHSWLGGGTGATPDGRKAKYPFADGAGPAQGRETKGPTAAILSTTSWDHSPMLGGVAFNMKFNSSLFDSPDGVERLRDLVLTYLRRGGFETQINVVDHEKLKKAQKNPEEYRDLVVRIGGYTEYFTRLSPEMQDEVMKRTEYSFA